MFRAFSRRLATRCRSGASAIAAAASWPSGPIATFTTSACRGATSSTRPRNPSGGLNGSSQAGAASHRGAPANFLCLRERAMMKLRFDDLRQYSDTLRSRKGEAITVRFVEPRDGEELQNYFRSLSTRSRYNRFLGAMSELPAPVLDRFTHVSEALGFTVVATMQVDDFETIVGEARYVFHAETESFEFGISIDDRWQGHGIGT